MSLEPIPPPSGLSRFGQTGAVVALVVLAGIAVVGSASFLGRQVGGALGNNSGNGPTVDVEPGLEVDVVVPSGASAQDIAVILAARGVVRSATEFEIAVRSAGAASSLRAGTYELLTGMTPSDVLDVLRAGPVADTIRVTIREGLRVTEIVQVLSEQSGIDEEELFAVLTDGSVTTSLREFPDDIEPTDWEGLLFPDTYDFSRSASAASILQRLSSTMEQRVSGVDWSAVEDAGLDVYEGLVLASLIESEVRVAEERPLVSSVIFNRLEEDMLLQIDATVLYALGTRSPQDFDREVDSPYNTYMFAGLPPTPIAAPGLASLEAAAAPEQTDFLFYVLSAEDGSHTFTTNLDDHNAAVRQAREEGILP
ncbi:endolytic transglycosylase MltG [soil metagenome]